MNNQITHSVELASGAIANTVGPQEIISEMYPNYANDQGVIVGRAVVMSSEITLSGFNSTLGFESHTDDQLAILRNTKTGTCPVPITKGCGNCAIAGSGLTTVEMSQKNCAQANTAEVFKFIDQDPRGAFMLLPTSDNSYVVDETTFTEEFNGNILMQNRLNAANSVVFTESWLRSRGLDTVSIAMNGADGSFGVATTVIEDETIFIPFCSMRTNMGDRPESKQILRQALGAYFDSLNFSEEKRQEVLKTLKISIDISASASLPFFAHNIQIPEDGSQYNNQLREKYPELISRANGKVTSAILLNDQYPGAFERGSIFPEFEAKMGIHTSPITPDNCPGDGQSCHVDYRSETQYALVSQLKNIGVDPNNIYYHDEDALDPSNPDNNLASNRAEQNNGVEVKMTNRTLNGMKIVLNAQENADNSLKKAFNLEAEFEVISRVIALPNESEIPVWPKMDLDPFVTLYELRMGHSAPPRELWDTDENRESAAEEGCHPMTYWLMASTSSQDLQHPAYKAWIDEVNQSKFM